MDWISLIERGLIFIEEELGNASLSPQTVARYIHVSESYLTRAFHILTGFTLSEYIRNRRLCVAVEKLKREEYKIKNILSIAG